MTKFVEKAGFLGLDFLTVNSAFMVWIHLRERFGFYTEHNPWVVGLTSLFLFSLWFGLFLFFGQYQTWYARSRTDEFLSVVKVVTIGVGCLFLVTMDVRQDLSPGLPASRLMIVSYWGLMVTFVGFGRVLVRTVVRRLLEAGIGRRRAVIVGSGKKAGELHRRIVEAPALGYDVIGIVPPQDKAITRHNGLEVLGPLSRLHRIIRSRSVQEVLIALPRRSEQQLEQVIAQCDGTSVGMKVVPDLYDVIIGQVRTNQIYGFPLIEILPQYMPTWERVSKRAFDFAFSLIVLGPFLPVWLVVALAITVDSRGPVFYSQKRVGKDGKTFSVLKFRTMIEGAEKRTGPVWASDNDPRVTKVGRKLRRLHFDEIPQFINVLKGDMSLVGPRPERPFFVEKLTKTIPLYSRRLRVQPGITGWAQVKGEYDTSLDKVKQKVEYDLFYLENMSLRMDLKIILITLYVMLRGKGQ
jgi:exopolysaccharide biosynthesis polyprenyl glycosylphosphotransferase